MKKDRKPFSII